ncbi:MAG TPA: S53 family peptidase [Dyella sp.]|uniref:S53 family peptidase n=1 Tax=Dyella sp. TaxID=1869338 RepID=UPI002F92BC66
MILSKRFWGKGLQLRQAVLPLALTLSVLSLSAHAAGSWSSTRTDAALLKSPTAGAAGWALNMHDMPALGDATVSPLEASRPLHVALSLNLRNEAQLQAFLHDVNQPGNPRYRQFLTPEEFKAQYAPTDAQVQQVVAHLKRSGFGNVTVADNNLLIEADGNAATVATAFNASMKTFNYNGRQHIANDSPAMVPQELNGIVNAVLGLQDVNVPHPMYHFARTDGHAQPQAAASQVAHSPSQFPAIYDVGTVPAASSTKVGIITWGDMTQTIADLKTFTTNAGMATANTLVVKTGSQAYVDDPNGDGEWNLDSQTIVGTSGGVSQLIFYATPNCSNDSCLTDAAITASYNRAVTDDVAKVINVSLGEDETAAHNSGTQSADDAIFAQAAAQGQTFSVASGDAGVYQWSSDPLEGSPGYVANSRGTVKITLSHYSVSEPASSPNVVAVGGTTLSTSGTTWSNETVWNEGLAEIDPGVDNNERLWATGGGVSSFETAPSWQTAALGSSVTKREVPDIAFDAAQSTGAIIYIDGQQYQIGGTSLASPIFVGVWARIQSAHGNAYGLPTQSMYANFSTHAPAPVHDVTSGNNGYNGYGYNAAAGWDNTTGWGSLDISKFNTYVGQYW